MLTTLESNGGSYLTANVSAIWIDPPGHNVKHPTILVVRRWLGDEAIEDICIPGASESELDHFRLAFPEANITDHNFQPGPATRTLSTNCIMPSP